MVKWFSWVLVPVVAVVVYFCVTPIPSDPGCEGWIAWYPPNAPALEGVYAPNNLLSKMKRLGPGADKGFLGPETVAFDSKGKLFGATEEGYIQEIDLNTGNTKPWIYVGGRPLGLAFDTNGNLFVAVAAFGLVKVTPEKTIELISLKAGDKPIVYADDLDIALNGDVYFSDATSISPLYHDGIYDTWMSSIVDIFSAVPRGRLLRYNNDTKQTEVLMDELQFANGVSLAKDGSFVLIAETGRYRVWRYWLKGPKAGKSEIFVENLVGFPDGVSRRENGDGFWIALVTPRNAALDYLHPYPHIKRISQKLPKSMQLQPARYSHVVEVSSAGKVVRSFQAPDSIGITSVTEREGKLYLGSLVAPWVGVYDLKE